MILYKYDIMQHVMIVFVCVEHLETILCTVTVT